MRRTPPLKPPSGRPLNSGDIVSASDDPLISGDHVSAAPSPVSLRAVDPASAPSGDTMAAQLARANAEIAALKQKVAEYQAREQPDDFVPLKTAVPPDISTEAVRQWAKKDQIDARRDGSRWFVSLRSLNDKLARWRASRS